MLNNSLKIQQKENNFGKRRKKESKNMLGEREELGMFDKFPTTCPVDKYRLQKGLYHVFTKLKKASCLTDCHVLYNVIIRGILLIFRKFLFSS